MVSLAQERSLSGLARSGAHRLARGHVVHVREGTSKVRFSRRIAMPLVDLGAASAAGSPHGIGLVSFSPADYLEPSGVALDTQVRELVAAELGIAIDGPVLMLAHLRSLGWLFNPIAAYYGLDVDGRVRALVLEVQNTPWHERHRYVIGPPGTHLVHKEMHVSPFLEMGLDYRITYDEPTDRLTLRIEVLEGATRRLDTWLDLEVTPLDRHSARRLVLGYPAMTLRVSAAIYLRALSNLFRGVERFAQPNAAARGPRLVLELRRAARRARTGRAGAHREDHDSKEQPR